MGNGEFDIAVSNVLTYARVFALMIAIGLRTITVRFGAATALERVNLEVRGGELLILLGPSGCGKSTLLRAIAGFVNPDSGTIHFGDEDVTHQKPHERSTGMVFQSFALWPHMSVAENVAFGLRERRVEKREIARRVEEALSTVRLAGYGTRRIDELSGGEQQRVALARALVVRPRCLLLDEPLSNLDAALRRSMRDEIRHVCKDAGLTAVYVTHDQEEALAIADRIAVMKRGRVVQVGEPAEIYRRPVSRGVAEFIGTPNLVPGTVTSASEQEVRVRSSCGDLVAAHPLGWKPAPSDKVWLSLRAESLSFAVPTRDDGQRSSFANTAADGADSAPKPAHAMANALAGKLESTTYLGAIAEHRFRCGEALLRVHELNPSEGRGSAPRDRVFISPTDVVVLPFDDDA